MSMRKPEVVSVEVDMVPLIDIISLLLMFLVVVGDMAKSTRSVNMKLPRADMAKTDPTVDTKHRLVVQLEKDENGKYWANIERCRYELVAQGAQKTLIDSLNQFIMRQKANGDDRVNEDLQGGIHFPVKLRIPKDAPMREAERLIQSMAQAKLVNIQYAADNGAH
jgi:biopolymer transport protein ExbD